MDYIVELNENEIVAAVAKEYMVEEKDVKLITDPASFTNMARVTLNDILKGDLKPILGTCNAEMQLDIIKCKLEQYKGKLQGVKLEDNGNAYKEAFNDGINVGLKLLEEVFGIESED